MNDRIAGYDMAPVTRASFLGALTRVLGSEAAETRWTEACGAVALDPDLPAPAAEDLQRVAKAFIEMGGLPSVVGSSMYVRLVTYSTLSKRAAAGAPGGSHD